MNAYFGLVKLITFFVNHFFIKKEPRQSKDRRSSKEG